MAQYLNVFFRVLKGYSIEEKVISLVVAASVLFFSIQGAVEIFRNPTLFMDEGGYYTEGLINERPTLLNPVYSDFAEADREISGLVFSGLTKYDTELATFVEDMAKLSISEDRMTYSFKIKDGIKWHDGQDLTADDVFFTFNEVIQNPNFQNPVLKANFSGVEINKVDDKTVSFKLSKPNSFFITNMNVGILPKHLLGEVTVADLPQNSFNLSPIGTGPYKMDMPIETINDGRQRVSLVINDDYYGEKPSIKNVRFHIYPSTDMMLKEQSTLNILSKVPKDIFSGIEETGRFEFLNYELPQYTAVFMNMDSETLKKDKVRVALQKAIDKNALLALLPNKTAVDTPLMELNQSEWLNKPNIEEANGALFDSGYKLEADNENPYRKNADGEILKLTLLVRNNEDVFAAEETGIIVNFLVSAWKNVGVEVEAQFENPDIFATRVASREYDLLLTGESLGYNLDTYAYWHSSQAGGNGLNLSNYKSFVADSLIERMRNTFDNDEKQEYAEDLAEEISKDVPAVFLFRPSYVFANDAKVKKISLKNLVYPSDRFDNITEWCIKCE